MWCAALAFIRNSIPVNGCTNIPYARLRVGIVRVDRELFNQLTSDYIISHDWVELNEYCVININYKRCTVVNQVMMADPTQNRQFADSRSKIFEIGPIQMQDFSFKNQCKTFRFDRESPFWLWNLCGLHTYICICWGWKLKGKTLVSCKIVWCTTGSFLKNFLSL